MALPLMVRAMRLSIEADRPRGSRARRARSAPGRWRTFCTITLPLVACPASSQALVLGFARSLGEFGATITFVSSIPGRDAHPAARHLFGALQVPDGQEAHCGDAPRACISVMRCRSARWSAPNGWRGAPRPERAPMAIEVDVAKAARRRRIVAVALHGRSRGSPRCSGPRARARPACSTWSPACCRPDRGRISAVGGRNAVRRRRRSAARAPPRVGYVFQDGRLFPHRQRPQRISSTAHDHAAPAGRWITPRRGRGRLLGIGRPARPLAAYALSGGEAQSASRSAARCSSDAATSC
jgi:hypothetical protein